MAELGLVRLEDVEAIELMKGVHRRAPLAGERMSVAVHEFEPGAAFPGHSHDEEEIIYFVVGKLETTVGGQKGVGEAGQFVLIPPRVEHGGRNTGDDKAVLMNIFSPPRKL